MQAAISASNQYVFFLMHRGTPNMWLPAKYLPKLWQTLAPNQALHTPSISKCESSDTIFILEKWYPVRPIIVSSKLWGLNLKTRSHTSMVFNIDLTHYDVGYWFHIMMWMNGFVTFLSFPWEREARSSCFHKKSGSTSPCPRKFIGSAIGALA